MLADRPRLRRVVAADGFISCVLILHTEDGLLSLVEGRPGHKAGANDSGEFLLIPNRKVDGLPDPIFPSTVAKWAYTTGQAEVLMFDPAGPRMWIVGVDPDDPMPLGEIAEDVSDIARVAADFFGKFLAPGGADAQKPNLGWRGRL